MGKRQRRVENIHEKILGPRGACIMCKEQHSGVSQKKQRGEHIYIVGFMRS
jgi:hypothetical protein